MCEITAIPELLKLLDIKGRTVTTDAIGTQMLCGYFSRVGEAEQVFV